MTHKDRTGTSADHLRPFAQCERLPCERRLSFGIPKFLQRVLHPLWNSSISFRSGNLTDAVPGSSEAEPACLTFLPSSHPCPSHRLCGTASRPSRNTSLLGMPASGGHRLWEPCQHGSPLCPQLFNLHSFSWAQSSLVVPRLAPSEGRLMRPVQFPHP